MTDPAYLDHAATTPLRAEARAAIQAAWDLVGNASSLHAGGRAARRVVEEARESLAADLGARPSDVVLTAGGTESDNLAVKGLFWARPGRRVVASPIEHPAVLDACRWLVEAQGAELTLLAVDGAGRVAPSDLADALATDPDDVALVTCMWANNEIGTIQPVTALAEVARAAGVPFHTDGVQALGGIPVDITATGADAVSLSAHKIGGPIGIGALVLRGRADALPVALLHGGGQERDLRSGTLDPAAAAGFAAAVRAVTSELATSATRTAALRDELVAGIRAKVPDAVLNGPALGPERLPGNAHLSFPGCEGDALLMLLDARGVACSTGSACSAGVVRASHVLLALGHEQAAARSSLRFSLGATSTRADVDAVLREIGPAVERARRAGLAGRDGARRASVRTGRG